MVGIAFSFINVPFIFHFNFHLFNYFFTCIKVNGNEQGVASYGDVCDLLVSWHIQEFVLPLQKEEEEKFNPYDASKVFPPETEATGG